MLISNDNDNDKAKYMLSSGPFWNVKRVKDS